MPEKYREADPPPPDKRGRADGSPLAVTPSRRKRGRAGGASTAATVVPLAASPSMAAMATAGLGSPRARPDQTEQRRSDGVDGVVDGDAIGR